MPNPIDLPRWQVEGTANEDEQPVTVRLSASDRAAAVRMAEQRFNMRVDRVLAVDPASTAGVIGAVCVGLGGLLTLASMVGVYVVPEISLQMGYVGFLTFFAGLAGLVVHGLHRVARSINRLRETLDKDIRT